jgi:hypothetical protein
VDVRAATTAAPAPAVVADGIAWAPTAGSGSRSANGSGNGQANGSGAGKGNGARASETAVRLRLLVRRTEDEIADLRKLERLQHLLDEAGQSPYDVIVALPSGRWRVSAPECRTRYSLELEQRLRDLLGDDVTVEPL